jgi:hypothetical protein
MGNLGHCMIRNSMIYTGDQVLESGGSNGLDMYED